nr:uncharacterized protein LOC127318592 [Lolium perenne]
MEGRHFWYQVVSSFTLVICWLIIFKRSCGTVCFMWFHSAFAFLLLRMGWDGVQAGDSASNQKATTTQSQWGHKNACCGCMGFTDRRRSANQILMELTHREIFMVDGVSSQGIAGVRPWLQELFSYPGCLF